MNKGQLALIAWQGGRTLADISYDLRIRIQTLHNYVRGAKPSRVNAVKLRDVAGIPVDAWDEPSDEPATQAK